MIFRSKFPKGVEPMDTVTINGQSLDAVAFPTEHSVVKELVNFYL